MVFTLSTSHPLIDIQRTMPSTHQPQAISSALSFSISFHSHPYHAAVAFLSVSSLILLFIFLLNESVTHYNCLLSFLFFPSFLLFLPLLSFFPSLLPFLLSSFLFFPSLSSLSSFSSLLVVPPLLLAILVVVSHTERSYGGSGYG
eukprot:m.157549 g.157549  ORF g.157549 m.157549 type:complete len:145 (-) comp16311_c0_seq1:2805-3239(-)